jgi:pimeloyl-ACP methyl ester carboxylesterase
VVAVEGIPIVLIHGLWLTPRTWEGWKEPFESRGYRVLARAWPRMEGEIEDIRRDPSPLNGLGLEEIVEHYANIVRDLDQPPIIIGHSFGGLVIELLLDRGLAPSASRSPAISTTRLRIP